MGDSDFDGGVLKVSLFLIDKLSSPVFTHCGGIRGVCRQGARLPAYEGAAYEGPGESREET
jgi:hypothetical protein